MENLSAQELLTKGNAAYSDAKNIDLVVTYLSQAIDKGVQEAKQNNASEAQSLAALSTAKKAAYNLASYTWPGWDEPGIVLTESHLQAGQSAAVRNLEFARQLKRGPEAFASAHWMVGAHALAAGKRANARDSFLLAVEQAKLSGNSDVLAVMSGYLHLADALDGDDEAKQKLFGVETQFRQRGEHDEDAQIYANQLKSAWNVFSR